MVTTMPRLVCAILIVLSLGVVGSFEDAAGWSLSINKCNPDLTPSDPTRCSLHPVIDLGTGGPQTTDTQLLFLLEVLEIGGFCTDNPGSPNSNTVKAKGKPYSFHGFSLKSKDINSDTQTKNGHIVVDLPTRTVDLQRMFDIAQALSTRPKFINLTTTPQGCPNPKWTFSGYEVTRANAQAAVVKVPSFTSKDLGESGPVVVYDSGHAEFIKTNCQMVRVPDLDSNGDGLLDEKDSGLYVLNPDGSIKMVDVEICDFEKSPMSYCSRFEGIAGPDGKDADSGLRIYWYDDPKSQHYPGEKPVPTGHDTFNVRECQVWRDVNLLPAYDLSWIGLYNPDTDPKHYVSPQTGSADAGGLALSIAPYNWWAATCHQHGTEWGNNDGDDAYHFTQLGPDKQHLDPNGVLTADWICQGGTQLMDGTYDDGILP